MNRDLFAVSRFEQQGDFRSAQLTLEQIIQAYPGNLEAKQELANFYARTGQRQAIDVWDELARVEPRAPKNQLELVRTALRFGELDRARAALQRLQQAGHTGPEYYRLAAGLAVAGRDHAALEQNLTELARLRPDDLRVQLNLALTRLQNSGVPEADAARATLIRLARTDQVRIRAIVELITDIARRWPQPATERAAAFQNLAREITPATGPRLEPADISDPVQRLLSFAMLQPDPGGEDVAALVNFMILNGRSGAASEWLDTLPAKTRNAAPVWQVLADAALREEDLPRLRQLLLAGAWGTVPPEAVRRAISARQRRGQPVLASEGSDWSQAIEAGSASMSGLRMLLRLSEAWRWPEERRQVLAAITQAFPRETWAWRQLVSFALAHADTGQLGKTYQRWSHALPGDVGIQVEAAIMGLLLQQRGAPKSRDTAELFRLHPGNPGSSVAHALALWREKRVAEARPLLESLPASTFAEPRYALVYGLVLADSDRASESERMLDRATAERLLPEEMALVEAARARNHRRANTPAKH